MTLVGMEATGVYWKTVFQALEDRFECWLFNAHHLRNVPGRKTDVKDSEWICQLVQHGLVRPSFVPPPEIRRLRDLTRLRTAQSNERARTIQRLEKVLQDAGIKLSSVASKTYSKSARAMLEALLRASPILSSSPSSPRARCAPRSRSSAKRSEPIHDRAPRRHGRAAARAHRHARRRAAEPQRADRARARPARPDHRAAVHDPRRPSPRRPGADRRVRSRHERVPDRRALRLLGRRLPRPPPISRPPEIGTNPPRAQLADLPADRVRPRRRPNQRTYLASHFAQLRGRRGEPKAIGAIRHDLLVAYYHIVRDQVPYRDLGPDWQRKRYSVEHRARRLQRQLEALGYTVTLEPNRPPDRTSRLTPTTKPSRPTADATPARTTLPKHTLNTGIHRSASAHCEAGGRRWQDSRAATNAGLPVGVPGTAAAPRHLESPRSRNRRHDRDSDRRSGLSRIFVTDSTFCSSERL